MGRPGFPVRAQAWGRLDGRNTLACPGDTVLQSSLVAQPPVEKEERLIRYVEELADALESCAEMISAWGAYADEYFQKKHVLEADVAYAKSHATRARRVASGADLLGEYDD